MKILFLIVIAILPLGLFGQAVNVNLGLVGAIPTNEFKEAVPSVWGLGAAGNVLVQVKETSPIYLGVDFNYIVYGTETNQEDMYVDGNLEEVDVTRNNNMIGFHFVGRVLPDVDLPVQPYGELMFGGKYIYTRSVIKSDRYEDKLGADTEVSDWAISYGGSAGVNIFLVQGLYLDLKLTYLAGGEAEYLTRKSVTYDEKNEQLVFDVKRSKTDLFLPHIGIGFVF
ncbi:hypothetical protein R9C00_27040 [Flammeovirgaceae bacterium SG7u.111]|nr:hypothetical protein [Flammeovirgaceae bacterium SG7u.132]WPO35357.1 hypothetical protein R9C00_27040 [Flammeovirgaceae bacterium SG7u.111]